jgi:hypothetical protein
MDLNSEANATIGWRNAFDALDHASAALLSESRRHHHLSRPGPESRKESDVMAQPYEQATEFYLAKALENGAIIDSPDSERSHLTKGTWHLRNFDGPLVGRVRRGNVHFASPGETS